MKYIYLKKGDTIQEGDEFSFQRISWIKTSRAGKKVSDGIRYRRPVQPLTKPLTRQQWLSLPPGKNPGRC